jgi:putative membrane protein
MEPRGLNRAATRAGSSDSTSRNDTIANETALPAFAKRRTLPGYLGVAARGFLMGSADVVPGVSGGTMAFILGIYEELINSIRAIARGPFLNALRRGRIGAALAAVNTPFLLSLVIGIFAAIVLLAPGIEWLLRNRPVYIWSFFFGLVLASVVSVSKRIPRWTPALIVALLIGAVGAYFLVGLVPVATPSTWWFLFASGALAICAMILPGISGSFILVLLGKYQELVAAVNQRDIVTLFWPALGAFIGLVTFAQLLGWLFRRYHDMTVAVLTGFMLGSLRKVWPWKEVVDSITDRHGEIIPTVERNLMPSLMVDGSFNGEVGIALLLALIGLVVVIGIDWWANRLEASPHGTAEVVPQ